MGGGVRRRVERASRRRARARMREGVERVPVAKTAGPRGCVARATNVQGSMRQGRIQIFQSPRLRYMACGGFATTTMQVSCLGPTVLFGGGLRHPKKKKKGLAPGGCAALKKASVPLRRNPWDGPTTAKTNLTKGLKWVRQVLQTSTRPSTWWFSTCSNYDSCGWNTSLSLSIRRCW